jgi:hypothetical protein
MPARRQHHKSRFGCFSCKTRRVKCDERGPICGSCTARNTTCRYESPNLCRQEPVTKGATTKKDLNPRSEASSLISLERCRSLELQLLHRWSTDTYKSVSTSTVNDDLVWQIMVPEMAMQHDFLLNGIFAVSAFDLARLCKNNETRYVSAALEYQDLAFRGFRTQLDKMTCDSYEPVLYFSLLLMALSLASSQAVMPGGEIDSKVQRTIDLFELLRGIGAVMLSDQDYYSAHPVFRDVKLITDLPKVPLAKDTEVAIRRLSELNDKRMPSLHDKSSMSSADLNLYNGCKKALFWLSECFATCIDVRHRGYCLAWIAYAGHDYVVAIQQKDNVALLIMAHWGVLTELLGSDYWWARSFGTSLISEISDEILSDADKVTRDAIAWAQEQVSTDSAEDRG